MTERLELDARLDTSAAPALLKDLRAKSGGDLTLDAAQVTHMGALCTQAILVAAKSFAKAGHGFRIENMCDQCVEQLRLFGLSPETLASGEIG